MRISDWSSDVCSSDLGPRTRRRNPRKLARSQPLPQYGRTARAEENRTTQSRMTSTMTANLQNLTHTTWIWLPSQHFEATILAVSGLSCVAFQRVFHQVRLTIRSEEHTSELQSLMRISYAVFCLKNKNKIRQKN